MGNIKGIFIDSGRVLNMAASGDWSFSPKFFEIIEKEKFNKISKKKINLAYGKAWKYVNSISKVETIEEEYKVFDKFFEIIAKELPELDIKELRKSKLTYDMVLNYDKYIFYKDVLDVLPKLSKKYKLCIVSDGWPSLRGVYKKAGLDKYFEEMIISSEVGINKPNEEIYKVALEKLGLDASEVIFVDDNKNNCDGAYKLGIKSIVLNRSISGRIGAKFGNKNKYKIIKNLYKLEEIL